MLHGHGDDWYNYSQRLRHNFSSNVWHEGTPASLLAHLQERLQHIGRYPEPNADSLAAQVAQQYGIAPGQCLFTNGATEAFYLIAQLFARESATIFIPTFAEYEDACRMHQLDISFGRREQIASSPIKTSLAFVCNPNNPDGYTNTIDEVEKLVKQHPSTVFVVDEAYGEFSRDAESALSLLKKYPNLLLVKSLTKLFAIPGLRLGYILGAEELMKKLREQKMPWSVNSLALAAGKFIFSHYEALKPDMQPALERSEKLQSQLKELPCFSVVPSKTTYFLLALKKGKAADLKNYLIQEWGLLVRDATNFRGLEGEYIRIASQSEEQNKLLLDALAAWNSN